MLQFFWVFFTLTQATTTTTPSSSLPSSSLPSSSLPSSSLHILVLCFWYAHEKARKRRDNRAPARIMSPQREMQLGPRVIQERRWWPRFKVVRDDPQPHLISPWLEFPLWHTHTHTHTHTKQSCSQTSTHTRCTHSSCTRKLLFFTFSLSHVCHNEALLCVFPSECVSRFIQTRHHHHHHHHHHHRQPTISWPTIASATSLECGQKLCSSWGNKSQTVYTLLLHLTPKSTLDISHQDSFPFLRL